MSPGVPGCACVGACECVPLAIGDNLGACLCAPAAEGGKKAVAFAITTGEGGQIRFGGADLEAMREALKGRGNIVMTRVDDDALATLDLLVEAGLFASRSECAAFLIIQGIGARKDLLERVKDTAEKIRQLREKVKREIAS